MFQITTSDAGVFWQVTGTAALGGVRAFTQFNLLSFVSATSLAVAATATTAFNIYISMTWQDMDITVRLRLSILLCPAHIALAHEPHKSLSCSTLRVGCLISCGRPCLSLGPL